MRILFSCNNITSHFGALLPVIRAAERAGHTVAVAAPSELGGHIADYGLEHIVAGREWLTPLATSLAKRLPATPLWLSRAAEPFFNARMAGQPAVNCARGIIAAAPHWKPDLIIRESMEFGGALAAEKLGVPSACIGIGCYVPKFFPPARMAKIFASSRTTIGLPKDPSGTSAYPFYTSLMPKEFDPLVGQLMPNPHYYQESGLAGDDSPVPKWLADIRADRPVVYGCLGSVALAYGGLDKHGIRMMEVMVSALSQLDCTAIVSTGGWVPPAHFGKLPDHVRVMNYVPQKLVLARADLFVTHAGYGSVRESIRAGVPMVTIPLIGDSLYVARRAVEAGIAQNISVKNLKVDKINQACMDVLSNPKYKRSVSVVRKQMLALPNFDALINDLSKLVSQSNGKTGPGSLES